MEAHEIELPSKPGAKLRIQTYTRSPLQDGSLPTLAVFLNGLMSPQSTWNPALDILLSQLDSPPSILTYDRYGQGDSDPDPSDPPDTVYGHDARCVVVDLHELIAKVCTSILHLPPPGPNLRLVFVANSIGCPLSRLYAAAHPGTISGFIFLDSMMANTDFVSLFPDPDAPDFDSDSLPSDISVDDIRHARQEYHKMFRPSVPNHEHLDRRNLRELLPHAEKPKLPRGPDGKSPLLTVVGHDWEVFATQSLEVGLNGRDTGSL
jgi:pimeloyl-ACP methyl ester carboxylesterase